MSKKGKNKKISKNKRKDNLSVLGVSIKSDWKILLIIFFFALLSISLWAYFKYIDVTTESLGGSELLETGTTKQQDVELEEVLKTLRDRKEVFVEPVIIIEAEENVPEEVDQDE
jgi:hypothetical protein